MAINKNKVSKEGVALLFCANMDGSEKLKSVLTQKTHAVCIVKPRFYDSPLNQLLFRFKGEY